MACMNINRIFLIVFFALSYISSLAYANKLKIITEEYAPISFTENGKVTGLAVEVVEEILAKTNDKTKIQVLPWARGYKMVEERKNTVLFSMSATPEREKLFTLIGPIAIGKLSLYSIKGNNLSLSSLDEIGKLKVGVTREGFAEQLLTKQGVTNLKQAIKPLTNAQKLMNKRIDLWAVSSVTVGDILKQAGFSLLDIEKKYTFFEDKLYICFSKNSDQKVVTLWLATLKAMKQDGSFSTIYKRWFPTEEPPLEVERIGI
ncbi:transporter substrate-binding domain-containing protein [Endozoicomonas sp. SM1973]|uniref:Transporter substrate-binding domain-containing protein n=1 Tax=Spartinivicinus marinus TaxID=2994442 RepID=A0A853IF74_9GAMM|nr:transporter substrate-binding domain-containing protein [Spartinivicinus marinus]MCX4025952.1 transporter substrate-binding domain-containing protein [Spartinivicinus marinus]NYZ68137.1 transporter substrate-binding domain-containing protein [Spartinivicinus marinus]